METIFNILVGSFVVVLGGGVLAIFKLRQLYYVAPKSFAFNPLSDDGQVVLIEIYNRARFHEKSVELELDPALSYQILAATSASITQEKNLIKFPKILKRSNTSLVLLVEPAKFTPDSVSSVHSVDTTAKSYNKPEDVPPNFGYLFLTFALVLGIMSLIAQTMFETLEVITNDNSNVIQNADSEFDKSLAIELKKLSSFTETGWDLRSYVFSDLRKSYSDHELPITLTSFDFNEDLLTIKYVVTNKLAAIITVHASFHFPREKETVVSKAWKRGKGETVTDNQITIEDHLRTNSSEHIEVSPGQSIPFHLSNIVPAELDDNVTISFTIYYGDETQFLIFQPKSLVAYARSQQEKSSTEN